MKAQELILPVVPFVGLNPPVFQIFNAGAWGGLKVEKHVKLFQIAQKELVEKHPYCMEQKMFVKEIGTCKYFLDFYLCKMIFCN